MLAKPLILVGAFVLGFPAVGGAEGIGPYRVKIKTKEVKGLPIKEIIAEAHYAQSPEKVWELLNHFVDFPKFIPRLKECEMLGTIDELEQIYFKFSLPVLMPDLWNIISLRRIEKEGLLEWKMIKGNMEMDEGTLDIDPEGKGSVVYLKVKVDPGRLFPTFLVTWGSKNFIPKVLKSIGDQLSGLSKPR